MMLRENNRTGYLQFIESCRKGKVDYGLTPRAETSAYARCFAIYGLHLLRQTEKLNAYRHKLIVSLCEGIRTARKRYSIIPKDKSYLQLLTFTLSALAAINALDEEPLADLVIEQLPTDVDKYLKEIGALDGYPQSGNHAMFLAIFLIYASERLGYDVKEKIMKWISLHKFRMNRFGFWGQDRGVRHLLFQNGYHQYEIFEYLSVNNPKADSAIKAIHSLADRYGHFAPFPGGGGCYDYDAVFILTPEGKLYDSKTEKLLLKTANAIISEQQSDGGFAESLCVRPRTINNFFKHVSHILQTIRNGPLLLERLRYALALQRPYHSRIHTHWSEYSRKWNESDLWDSWFRMLTLARIETAFEPAAARNWGFINFPGIGYHPSLRLK